MLAALLFGAFLFVWAFSLLPIEDSRLAIDWKQIWRATHTFRADYLVTELRTPPWALPPIWLFSLFSLGLSWGLAAFSTLTILVISVSRAEGARRWLAGVIVLACSYLALRQFLDGNLEALVISGILLLLSHVQNPHPLKFAGGLLLATAKIQETWWFLFVLAFYLLRKTDKRSEYQGGIIALLVSFPLLLWKGNDWLLAMQTFPWGGTAIDSSLSATWTRLSFPPVVYWVLFIAILGFSFLAVICNGWRPDRLLAGSLLAAGMLAGPYAASNSAITPLAIGVIPLFQKNIRNGSLLLILFNIPYLALSNPELRQEWEASYWTLVLFISWIFMTWDSLRRPDPV